MAISYVRTPAAKGHAIPRARYDLDVVFDATGGQLLTPRASKNGAVLMQCFEQSGRAYLGQPDWVHIVKAASDLGVATFVAEKTYAIDQLALNGQAIEAGDLVEVTSTVAKAVSVTPPMGSGQYRAITVTDAAVTIQNQTPTQYTLSSSSEMGGAVYYMRNADGSLEGLNALPIELSGAPTQTRTGYDIFNVADMLDGNSGTWLNATGASWHGVWANLKVRATVPGSPPAPAPQADALSFACRALEFRIAAARYSYDRSTTYATFGMTMYAGRDRSGANFNLNNNPNVYRRDSLAVSNSRTWVASSEAAAWFVYRPANGSAFTVASFLINDDSGSRMMMSDFRPICEGLNSQIKLAGNVTPEAGSILNISADVGNRFIPAIEAGARVVVKNDNIGPWKLGPILRLISPIGAAISWGLYVDDSVYEETYTGQIIFEVGTPYRLRLNSPEAIGDVDYTISYPGSADVVMFSTNAGNNFTVNYRPTPAQLAAANGANGTLTVLTDLWEKTYTLKLQYTQRGEVAMDPNNDWPTGSTFAINFTPDRLRVFAQANVTMAGLNGVAVGVEVIAAEPARSFGFVVPAVGSYRMTIVLSYTDTNAPSETFVIPFRAIA